MLYFNYKIQLPKKGLRMELLYTMLVSIIVVGFASIGVVYYWGKKSTN